MPQLDFATFPTQLFWLLISFSILYCIIWRTVIPRISNVMEERQSRVNGDLERANNLQAEAKMVLNSYEKALTDGRSEAQNLLKETALKIAKRQIDQETALSERIKQMSKDAEARIKGVREKAMADVKVIAVELAQATTAKLFEEVSSEEEVLNVVEEVMEEKV
ncbi:MAG: hypothetical protein CMM44_10570 [Rhodospirillaceae bacterium]|nr:hypothetical protein [Rhodospirillaceae bacterium]